MSASVLRWTVPVGEVAQVGAGPVVLVQSRRSGEVDVWTIEPDIGPDLSSQTEQKFRTVEVFGTGHLLPDDHGQHIGSSVDGSFVWHVFEVTS